MRYGEKQSLEEIWELQEVLLVGVLMGQLFSIGGVHKITRSFMVCKIRDNMALFCTTRIIMPRVAILFMIFSLGLQSVFGETDNKAKILYVVSQTEDLVDFRISLKKNIYEAREDIAINYQVRNKSKKDVFVVTEPLIRLSSTTDRWMLQLDSPVQYPDEFKKYNYRLVKISPGRAYQSTLVIERKQIPSDKAFNEESWTVNVGFSYLFDASKLLSCSHAQYQLPCLTELFNESKSLNVGNLVFETRNR